MNIFTHTHIYTHTYTHIHTYTTHTHTHTHTSDLGKGSTSFLKWHYLEFYGTSADSMWGILTTNKK
jgi:hypothetical protein